MLRVLVLWVAATVLRVDGSPVSRPVVNASDVDRVLAWSARQGDRPPDRGYHTRSPLASAHVNPKSVVPRASASPVGQGNRMCPLELEVLWSTQLGSSVYATPVVRRSMFGDGGVHVVVPTFVRFLEMIDGAEGLAPVGWPLAFDAEDEEGRTRPERSSIHLFQGSAAVHDVNGDGNDDICVVDTNGDVFWVAVGAFGEYLHDYRIRVPKLKVRRDWFVGLDERFEEEFIELSMFQHDYSMVERVGEDRYGGGADDVFVDFNHGPVRRATPADLLSAHASSGGGRRLSSHKRRLLDETQPGEPRDFGDGGMQFGDDFNGGSFRADDLYYFEHDHHPAFNDSAFIALDAHVLSTPTVADINNDGHVEILLSVSYFFDRRVYKDAPPEDGVDITKYVAGGVACFDLEIQDWVWSVHLDLTTDDQKWRAYIYAAPTVADLDGDGAMEVVVGTSLGLLYVLDAQSGFVREGFPMQFGPIEAQVAVANVAGGEDLEMIFVDLLGNLVVVDHQGEVVWDRLLAGGSSATPSIGDVDGDGELDIVCMTTSPEGKAHLWAVRGDNGNDLPHFPIQLQEEGQGQLSPPVLLVDLHQSTAGSPVAATRPRAPVVRDRVDTADNADQRLRGVTEVTAELGGSAPGLHLVVPTYDGRLHVVEGGSGCANHADVGEHVYAMPLAEDLQGDGLLDLVVGTMNGELTALGTSVPFHPLNAWPSQPQGGRNGFTHGRTQGIFVQAQSARFREVFGRFIPITFEIVDSRPPSDARRFVVTVSLGSNSVHPLQRYEYTQPGVYSVEVELDVPQLATIVVQMVNDHGQAFSSTFAVSYNRHFHKTLKWMAALPLLLVAVPLLWASPADDAATPLPS